LNVARIELIKKQSVEIREICGSVFLWLRLCRAVFLVS